MREFRDEPTTIHLLGVRCPEGHGVPPDFTAMHTGRITGRRVNEETCDLLDALRVHDKHCTYGCGFGTSQSPLAQLATSSEWRRP